MSSENGSGLRPVEFKVLVKPEAKYTNKEVVGGIEHRKTAGGILIPQEVTERDDAASAEGEIVDIGGRAFEDFGEPRPRVGDEVFFGRYAGQVVEGDDGDEYRLLQDKDVAAIKG